MCWLFVVYIGEDGISSFTLLDIGQFIDRENLLRMKLLNCKR